ncbi:MAG: DUF1259 domain-containing protein [Candidatus Acidiferrales bacterium]
MIRVCTAFLLVGVLSASLAVAGQPPAGTTGWERVAEVLGKKGDLSADGVYKVTFPRNELHVTMHGAPVPVGMGLASWAAFMRLPEGKAMVMGDTVMLASEVNPVIDELRKGGIEIVALHNHMLGEQPQVMFMHYQGVGEPEALARIIRRALDQLGKDQAR